MSFLGEVINWSSHIQLFSWSCSVKGVILLPGYSVSVIVSVYVVYINCFGNVA